MSITSIPIQKESNPLNSSGYLPYTLICFSIYCYTILDIEFFDIWLQEARLKHLKQRLAIPFDGSSSDHQVCKFYPVILLNVYFFGFFSTGTVCSNYRNER